jgi:WD40 repeat protein
MFRPSLTLAGSVTLLFAIAAPAQEEKTKWRYTPDALDKPINVLDKPWLLFTPKKFNEFSGKTFVFPTTPSQYLVMLTGGGGPQRLDLANRKMLPPLNVDKHLNGNLSPDGKYYVVLHELKEKAWVWSFQTGKQLWSYEAKKGEGIDFADFGAPGTLVLSIAELSKDGVAGVKATARRIEIRNIEKKGDLEKSFTRTRYGVPTEFPVYAFSPNRKVLALPYVTNKGANFGFRLYDLAAGESLGTTELTTKNPSPTRGACISPDGTKLASINLGVAGQKTLLVWDLTTGKFITNAGFAGDPRLAPSLWVRQIDWLGDSKHLFILTNIVVDAINNKIVYTYDDKDVTYYYFLGAANAGDLLLWNRTKGIEALQLVTPKLEK